MYAISSFIYIELKSSLMKRYEKAITAMAKQRVTLEVLSYHATAPEVVPSAQHYRLHSFDFDDEAMTDHDTFKVKSSFLFRFYRIVMWAFCRFHLLNDFLMRCHT